MVVARWWWRRGLAVFVGSHELVAYERLVFETNGKDVVGAYITIRRLSLPDIVHKRRELLLPIIAFSPKWR